MPRTPKPWPHNGWYVTNSLGKSKQRICPVADGIRRATLLLAQMLAAGHEELNEEGGAGPTLKEALGEFLSYCREEKSRGTADWYECKLGLLLTGPLKEKKMSSLSLEDGLSLKRSKSSEWSSPTTFNMFLRAARAFFNWSAQKQRSYVTESPWKDMRPMKEKGRERIITDEEFSAILASCQDGTLAGGAEDFREQLRLLRLTAMRPGELRALRWEYVVWTGNRITFPADVVKTRSKRSVTLVDEAAALLRGRQQRRWPQRENGFVFTLPGRVGGVLVAGASDKPISAQTLQRRWARLMERCRREGTVEREKDGERLVLYSARHSRITELLKAGLPVQLLKEEAGHKDLKTTMRYVHDLEDHVNREVRKYTKSNEDQG